MCIYGFSRGFVQYRAKGRISAEAALQHPYFKSLGERVHLLPDSKCRLCPPKKRQKKGSWCLQVPLCSLRGALQQGWGVGA